VTCTGAKQDVTAQTWVTSKVHYKTGILRLFFWDMKPCSLVHRYQHFRWTCCLHLHGNRSTKHWHLSIRLCGITSHKTITLIFSTADPQISYTVSKWFLSTWRKNFLNIFLVLAHISLTMGFFHSLWHPEEEHLKHISSLYSEICDLTHLYVVEDALHFNNVLFLPFAFYRPITQILKDSDDGV
jgi:hypothetical protein